MNIEAYRELKVLEALSGNRDQTQRTLAKRLGVALGLANLMIKRLVNKGHVKIISLQRNRIQYLLTSQGLAEKTRLTYEYLEYSLYLYRRVREILRDNLQRVAAGGGRRIVLFGSGEVAEIAYLTLRELGLELAAVVDDDRAGQVFLGHPVMPAEHLAELAYDCGVVASVSEGRNNLSERLQRQGIPEEKLIVIEQHGSHIAAVPHAMVEHV